MMPKTIGRYRIKAELGRGGMSTVYLAHDPHFERDVAIKLLPLELLHQSTFRRRFEREAKVVAALDHPSIVPVYDFGDEDGQPFLVMRFMTGGSLSDRLKQGALTIQEAVAIIKILAPALDEVHAHSVIHRDLKPSNILFDHRNEPYLSDFGTAKLAQAQTKLTETGGAVGTPAYMSPEQIQGDAEIDGRSDIYSLGVILFEMLTGNHPYDTDTPIGIAVKHMFEPVPLLLDVAPNLPIELQTVVSRAMAKNRAERYVTAVAFAANLEAVADKIQNKSINHPAVHASPHMGRRMALVIAIDKYKDPTLDQLVKPLGNPHDLQAALTDGKTGAFDEVILLQNETTQVIRRAISQFFTDRQPSDTLLLYYIGHAAIGTRSRLYLTASDTEHHLLRGTAIPASFIADEMDNSRAKTQILILDCHYSNAIDTDLPSLVGQTVNSGATFTRNGHERVVITATDSTQFNWQKDEIRGKAAPSQFTKHLINGLRTGAADLNQDGRITIDEMFAFIYDRVARNSVDEQIQMPRKWTPYAAQDGDKLLLAHNPRMAVPSARAAGVANPSANPKRRAFVPPPLQNGRWLYVIVGLILITGILLGLRGGTPANATTETPTSLAMVVPATVTAAETSTATPSTSGASVPDAGLETAVPENTAIAADTERATPAPSPTVTAAPTETASPAVSPTVSASATLTTTALLSSSLFAAPDAGAQEVTFVGAGETVIILGRAEFGEWLYVQTAEFEQGYVYGPRFDWEGDYNELSVITDRVPVTVSSGSCTGTACTALEMDLYPLPGGRCEPNMKYRTVFIQGHGGSGVFTYYWNNVRLAGPISNEGFGFEVSSPDGAAVIGTGRVESSDGQQVSQELFVHEFTCND